MPRFTILEGKKHIMTMEEIINKNSHVHPDKVAFVFGDKKYTFAQFNQRVNRLINGPLFWLLLPISRY
jgi:acyl-CoA synthetase (AMP-forming)/AMP-acid ligase II